MRLLLSWAASETPCRFTCQVRDVDGQSVEVEITFQVSFIKSTYMKYIIERSTNYEMTKWLEAFFVHLRQVTSFKWFTVITDSLLSHLVDQAV